MYISIIVNLLNVAFGFWFVYGLHWGIAGVAWGTVVAQYGGLATASALSDFEARLIELLKDENAHD